MGLRSSLWARFSTPLLAVMLERPWGPFTVRLEHLEDVLIQCDVYLSHSATEQLGDKICAQGSSIGTLKVLELELLISSQLEGTLQHIQTSDTTMFLHLCGNNFRKDRI